MSFPASLTTRIVKGRFVTYPDGTPAKGTVRIALQDFLQGPADDTFVVPFDRTVPLDEYGAFSMLLPATNDPDWTGSSYRLVVSTETESTCVGRNTRERKTRELRAKFYVPYTDTAAIDLADILNLPAPTVGEQYIILASKGVPGGVATLDNDGKLTASQFPAITDVEVSWDDVTDKPSVFPHDPIAFADVTGKPSTYPAVPTAWADITSKPSTFPHDEVTFAQVTGKPSVYPSLAPTFSEVTDKPATYPHDTITWTEISGKPSTFPPAPVAFSDITDKPSTYPHDPITWSEITSKPSTFPHDTVTWSEVTSKPTTFPAAWADITGIPDLATQTEMEAGDAAVLYTASLAYDLASVAAPAAAVTTALALKADLASPTFTGTVAGISKAMVSLGSVDNTADTAKPVSSAQQTALNLKANLASPTFTGTVSGISSTMVGLGNVSNTSDANKPISTATALALAGFISPADQNYAGWTFPTDNLQGGLLLPTAGLSYIVRIRVLTSVISAIVMHVITPGTVLVNCFATLHNDAGAILGAGAVTADQSTPWQSGGIKTMNLSTPQGVTAGNWYKVRFWVGSATTKPTFARAASSSGDIMNAGLVSPNFRFATADSSMSTLALAPGNIGTPTAISPAWWVALVA